MGFDVISLEESHGSHESHWTLIRFPLDLMGFHWVNPMDPIPSIFDTVPIGFDVVSLGK